MSKLEKFCLEIGKNLLYTAITLTLVAALVLIPILMVTVIKSN